MLTHLITRRDEGMGLGSNSTRTNEGDAPKASLKDRLQSCQSRQEVQEEIVQSFVAYLRHQLQLTASTRELMEMTGREIGFDSLVSVDIRTWFLKTLSVSIPVLRIAGNETTIASLVQDAAERMPSELAPLVPAVIGHN